MDLLTSIGTYVHPVPDHPLGPGVRARVRPLSGRAPQRRAGRRLLDRLRPRAVRLRRPAGTRWKFSAIPLGGYVKMHGDADADQLDDRPQAPGRSRTASRPRACGSGWRSSPPGRSPTSSSRSSCLASLFATVGRPVTPAEVGEVQPGSAAERGGPAAGRPDRRGRRRAARELRGAPASSCATAPACR